MTTRNIPPDIAALISKMSQRIDILERRLRTLEGNYEPELPFVQSGSITVGESPPFIRRKGGKLVEVVAVLGTAGTSATVIQVRKNGASIGSMTIGGGVTDAQHLTLSEPAAANMDKFTAAVTVAGGGAADLTVHTRWDQ